jgi:hypothetical protein
MRKKRPQAITHKALVNLIFLTRDGMVISFPFVSLFPQLHYVRRADKKKVHAQSTSACD